MADPFTGRQIPKDLEANKAWRHYWHQRAAANVKVAENIRAMCRDSPIFFCNFAGFTFRQFEVDEEGRKGLAKAQHLPFVTWPCQDHALMLMRYVLENGLRAVIDKSRDMGATWLCCIFIAWLFLFVKDSDIKALSRKEEEVDKRNDRSTIFGKFDYIFKYIPRYLLPGLRRTYMNYTNLALNCSIVGESANQFAGRGGRYKLGFGDEFAAVPKGNGIISSMGDACNALLLNSTPLGPGTAYSQARFSGKYEVIILHWTMHPEKGRNRELVEDDMGGLKWVSPWYINECNKRASPRDIAENLDIDHLGAGALFFDTPVITRQQMMYAQGARYLDGELDFRQKKYAHEQERALKELDGTALAFVPAQGRKRWRIFCELIGGRPDQRRTYVVSADVAQGTGSSNSIISVFDADSGVKCAQFTSPGTPPHELEVEMRKAGVWFGGLTQCAFLIVEANGPGAAVVDGLQKARYPYQYRRRVADHRKEPRTDLMHFRTTRESKIKLYSLYRRWLALDLVKNLDQRALQEAMGTVWYEEGGIGPSALEEYAEGAREAHGDMVMADALGVLGCIECRMVRAPQAPVDPRSFEGRRQRRKERKAA